MVREACRRFAQAAPWGDSHPVVPADPLFGRSASALVGRYTLVRELGAGGMTTVPRRRA